MPTVMGTLGEGRLIRRLDDHLLVVHITKLVGAAVPQYRSSDWGMEGEVWRA